MCSCPRITHACALICITSACALIRITHACVLMHITHACVPVSHMHVPSYVSRMHVPSYVSCMHVSPYHACMCPHTARVNRGPFSPPTTSACTVMTEAAWLQAWVTCRRWVGPGGLRRVGVVLCVWSQWLYKVMHTVPLRVAARGGDSPVAVMQRWSISPAPHPQLHQALELCGEFVPCVPQRLCSTPRRPPVGSSKSTKRPGV